MENLLLKIQGAIEVNAAKGKKGHDQVSIIKEAIGNPDHMDKSSFALALAEIYSFQFIIKSNELKPMFVWTDKSGMTIKEPDIENFSEEQLSYLAERQKNSQDFALKARYSHILWLSKERKIEYAREAIYCYKHLVNEYAELDKAESEHDHWLEFLDATRNLLALSLSVGYQTEEVKQIVIHYVREYNLQSSAASVVRRDLAELMKDHKSLFKAVDFEAVVDSLKEVYDIVHEKQLHHAIELLETILAIEQKLNKDLVKWKRLIAIGWEKIARNRGIDAAIVTINFCIKAILAYEEIGDEEKVRELYDFYDELRSNVELTSFPVGESKEAIKFYDELAKAVIENESDWIIQFLMLDKKVLPQKAEIIGSANKENDFLKMVHTTVFDQNGNTNRHYSSETEKNIEELIFGYTVHIGYNFHLIQSIILGGIKAQKLTYDKVLRYLLHSSWYGQELKMGKRRDSERPFKWLSIIAPGIVDFFVAMDGLIYAKKVYNITTSFDSLTLKIEGIVRTLAEYHGIHTFTIKKDNLGREVSEEMDIMKLLTHSKIVEFIGEDDIFFLRYVFTEKGGFNLRNKVAHSLIGFDQYSIGQLMLIFVAILRLGRFQLRPINSTS
jgi:Domain of unknown function (DUF4209)